MDILHVGSELATILGAFVIFFAASQFFLTKRLAQMQFEDVLTAQYRQIVKDLPLEAPLGKELDDKQMGDALKTFYLYFDLSNEQVFLYKQGRRISDNTWKNWRDGMAQNLQRPAFQKAWQQLSPDLHGSFDYLKGEFHDLRNLSTAITP
jgi:hypothetical protein